MPSHIRPRSLDSQFSGYDHICHTCAEEAHRAAGTICPHVSEQWMFCACCASCGDLGPLLPADLFEAHAPSRAAHKFAVAVLAAGHPNGVGRIRARTVAGRHWVEFQPIGGLAIHTEATRSPAAAVALFVDAAERYPTRPL